MEPLKEQELPRCDFWRNILGSLAQGKELMYSLSDMFYGFIPGSVGETSTIINYY